jgi:hypothetical protein
LALAVSRYLKTRKKLGLKCRLRDMNFLKTMAW